MKTVLLLVLAVSAIAIIWLLWHSRRTRAAGAKEGQATGSPTAADHLGLGIGRHRDTSVTIETAPPLVRAVRAEGAHRA